MREPKKPKRSRVRTWCPGGGVMVHHGCGPRARRNRHVRCGTCKQRFEVRIQKNECCDTKDLFVPRHKAY